MYQPPPDSRLPPDRIDPTWSEILLCYALLAAVPLVLWAASDPLAGAAVFVTTVGLVAGGRHTVRLVRCLRRCGGFTVDLPGVQVCITRTGTACSTT
jgi:hypothetical protein